MSKEAKLNGRSKARGRNGWFIPRTAEMSQWGPPNATEPQRGPLVDFSIRSSHYGDFPPIYLELTVEDTEAIISLLQEGLDEARSILVEIADAAANEHHIPTEEAPVFENGVGEVPVEIAPPEPVTS